MTDFLAYNPFAARRTFPLSKNLRQLEAALGINYLLVKYFSAQFFDRGVRHEAS